MKLSARNQFSGEILQVTAGAVNGLVTLKTKDFTITGTISMNAIKELGLVVGKEATAIVKATEVMIGLGDLNLSARNKFAGEISTITEGAVNDVVVIKCGNSEITATISHEAVKELALRSGLSSRSSDQSNFCNVRWLKEMFSLRNPRLNTAFICHSIGFLR